jgi:hypothetical protein
MAIARYRTGYPWEPLVLEKDGDWVKWDDHEAEVAELLRTHVPREQYQVLIAENERLKASRGMTP